MFKKAFTIVELVIALAIVAILAAVTIGIAKTKMAKVDKYSYYIAYSTMLDIAANIISQTNFGANAENLKVVSIYDEDYIVRNMPNYMYSSAFTSHKMPFLNKWNKSLDKIAGLGFEENDLTPGGESGQGNTKYKDYESVISGGGHLCHYWKKDPIDGSIGVLRKPDDCTADMHGENEGIDCLFGAPGAYAGSSALKPTWPQPNYGSYVSRDIALGGRSYEGADFYCFKYPKKNSGGNGHGELTGETEILCDPGQYKNELGECIDCESITNWLEYKELLLVCPEPDCAKFGMTYDADSGTCANPNTAMDLCKQIKLNYNISGSACDITAESMQAGIANGFSAQTPHIKMSNGIYLYIASDLVNLAELSDAQDVNDRTAYLIYVDVNGEKKGKGTLYQDVFPFYLTKSGKVIPAYNSTVESGGNCAEHLSLNVLYDEYTADGKRIVKAADTNKDFHTAACETGYIRSAKYCGTIAPITQCSDPQKDCRFIVNKPMKFFK